MKILQKLIPLASFLCKLLKDGSTKRRKPEGRGPNTREHRGSPQEVVKGAKRGTNWDEKQEARGLQEGLLLKL